MKCEFCQFQQPEGANFCANCGARFQNGAAQVPPPPPPPPAPHTVLQQQQVQVQQVKPKKPKGFGIASWVLLSVAVLLISIAFAAVLAANSPDPGTAITFLLLGGIFAYMLSTLYGYIFIGIFVLLGFIFAIVQMAKTRRVFSWLTLVFALLTTGLFVASAIYSYSQGHFLA